MLPPGLAASECELPEVVDELGVQPIYLVDHLHQFLVRYDGLCEQEQYVHELREELGELLLR
jgi:hypothetical protein